MKKNYIAPQVLVSPIGIQSILCASAGPVPTGDILVDKDKHTIQVW